jgi:hypothetical protein
MTRVDGNSLKRLAETLKAVFANTSVGKAPPLGSESMLMVGGSGAAFSAVGPDFAISGTIPADVGPSVTIFGDGYRALTQFVDDILELEELKGFIAAASVREQVVTVIRGLRGQLPGSIAQTISTSIIDPLRATVEDWTCLIPLVDLDVQTPLQIGSVTFIGKGAEATGFGSAASQHLEAHLANDRDARSIMLSSVFKSLEECGSAYAMVRLRADKKHAYEVALIKASEALNLLRAFTRIYYHRGDQVRFGLPTEVPAGAWLLMAMSEKAINTDARRRGTLARFELDSEKVKDLQGRLHFSTLHQWAVSGALGPKTLARAIWESLQNVGRSKLATSLDQELVYCIMAMEILLFPDQQGTITEKFAERAAFLLCDAPEPRKGAYGEAKRLYGLRSKVVHEGFRDVDPADASLAERFALNAALKAIELQPRFEDHSAFCTHLHEKKFG